MAKRRETRQFEATWTETRQVAGVVRATSPTDAAKRIRAGEGQALRRTTPSCTAPIVKDPDEARG